jgi:hypothetical protein
MSKKPIGECLARIEFQHAVDYLVDALEKLQEEDFKNAMARLRELIKEFESSD